MRLASALACLLALTVGSAASGADWTLDLFSYYRFADETKARQIEGGVIPVEVGSGVLGTWTLTVRAKQVTLDPIVAGPEEILDLALASDGSGQLSFKNGEIHGSLSLTLAIRRRGYDQEVLVPLHFTTEAAASQLRPTVSIRGAALDPGSGFLQFVAVAEEPWSRPPLVGRSFEVVLSGRLSDLPENLQNATP